MYIGLNEFWVLVRDLNIKIKNKGYKYVYGVPTGGSVVALALSSITDLQIITEGTSAKQNIKETIIVDDILDSGKTRSEYPDNDFEVLINKKTQKISEWVDFWFEHKGKDNKDLVLRIAQKLGVILNE